MVEVERAFNGHQIKNVQVRPVFWPSLDSDSIEKTFREVRSNTFSFNIFVLGETSTLNQVLASVSIIVFSHHTFDNTFNQLAQAWEYYMFGSYKNWYFISKEKGRLLCPECNNIQVAISQPLRSYLHNYEHEPPIQIGNDTTNAVDIYFNYDLARSYIQVIDQMVNADEMAIVQMTYPICGKYLSDGQLKQRSSIRLYDQLSREVLHGMFGQFMFNYNSHLNYQELIMRINTVMFRNGTGKQIAKMAEWEFEGHIGHLYFTSPQEKSERAGIAHYNIVTLIVRID